MTDTQLIAAAKLGDAEAWRELYGRWLPWVWRYAYSLVRDQHVAEDVTSEAMTAWVKNFDATGVDAPQAAAWLRSVVRNKAADHHRRSGRARRAGEGLAAITPDCPPDQAPSHPLELRETRLQVQAALTDLSEPHRLVLEWKYGEGLSVRCIAERLGVSEKSIESHLYRARREFRRQYLALTADQRSPDAAAECSSPLPQLRLA